MKIIFKFVFLSGLFLLPLVFWPRAKVPYEIPKVWFFQRWVELLGVLGMLGMLGVVGKMREMGENGERKRIFLVVLVILFVLIASLSSLLGVDFEKSFWGNYYRGDGLLTLFYLVAFFSFLNLFWEESWKIPVAMALSLGCFGTSLWTLFLGFRFHILKDASVYRFGNAIGATFGQPNFLAGYLLVCLPFVAFLIGIAKGKKKKLFWWMVFVFEIGAIVLTLSRAGILGIFLFGISWFLLKRRKFLGILGVLGMLGVLGLVFLFTAKNGFMQEGRERIFTKGILAFSKRPIFGWGWANFDYAFKSVKWPIMFNQDVYVDKAHSNLLEILVTTGIVGFLIYATIILMTTKILYKRAEKGEWERALLLVFLLFLFHSQTNVISIAEELIFWMILGIAATS